jgi:hypothetical protein
MGTGNHIVVFDEDYIELLDVLTPTEFRCSGTRCGSVKASPPWRCGPTPCPRRAGDALGQSR